MAMFDPRDWMTTRDWTLWGVLALLMLLESLAVGGYGSDWVWTFGSVVAVGIAVVFRRRMPLLAFAAAATVSAVEVLESVAGDNAFKIVHLGILVLISYLVGRHSDATGRFLLLLGAGLLVVGAFGVALRDNVPLTTAVLNWFWLLIAVLIFVVLPWLYGRYRVQHARLLSEGWELAERMESEQRMALEQARLRERTRIARDMHDSLGHDLSLIALRAGALEVDGELSERHRRAAGGLRTAAAEATERLGELVGVLRADDGAAPLQPPAEPVEQIIARAKSSGMTVVHGTDGSPRSLPALASQAAARVTQEGLTNAAKHAPGESVTLDVRWLDHGMELRVRNVLPIAVAPAQSGGHGLAGLGERLRLIGGDLAYRSVDDRFELTARIPYDIGSVGRESAAAEEQSVTASERASVRHQARRGLRTAIAAPVAVGGAIGVVMLAYYLVLGYASVLSEQDYGRIEVGQDRGEVDDLVPGVQMIDAPTGADAPDGSSCDYYRSAGPFSSTFAYQLCFDDDVLVSKRKVQTGSTPIEGERR